MSCEHCCGIDQLFDLKSAEKKMKHYLNKGPDKPTRLLINSLKSAEIKGLSLLDIGGGIGIIPLELKANGISKVTNVDASNGYIQVAKKEVANRNYSNLIEYHFGDFLDLSQKIESHDIVTLDKVICCYPDVVQLLKKSLSKSNSIYALVYPQRNWVTRLLAVIQNLHQKFQRNPFRSFIHSPKLVENIIEQEGFKRIYRQTTFLTWQIHLYKKVELIE